MISDNRMDGFSVCCFSSHGVFTKVKFGFIQDGVFVEQTAVGQIDFEREYVLQLTGDRAVEF